MSLHIQIRARSSMLRPDQLYSTHRQSIRLPGQILKLLAQHLHMNDSNLLANSDNPQSISPCLRQSITDITLPIQPNSTGKVHVFFRPKSDICNTKSIYKNSLCLVANPANSLLTFPCLYSPQQPQRNQTPSLPSPPLHPLHPKETIPSQPLHPKETRVKRILLLSLQQDKTQIKLYRFDQFQCGIPHFIISISVIGLSCIQSILEQYHIYPPYLLQSLSCNHQNKQ